METLFKLIKRLMTESFYGSLEIRFEAGKIVYLKKIQTIKITE